jgi:predicted nucleic acid-binding protein
MRRVFVDAGYWIALVNPKDSLHPKALQISATLGRTRVVTSEMVLAEVLNAFASKAEALRIAACSLVDQIRSNPNAEIVPMTSNTFREAMERYRSRPDKTWGLTDCTSFLIMEQKGNHGSAQRRPRFSTGGIQRVVGAVTTEGVPMQRFQDGRVVSAAQRANPRWPPLPAASTRPHPRS